MSKGIPPLTTSLCQQILSSTGPQDPVWASPAVVQILLPKTVGNVRWRVLISDGTDILQAMVATQLNALFEDKKVVNGSIVRVQRLAMNSIKDRRIVIIPDLEVLVKGAEKIGDPTPLSLDSPDTSTSPPSASGSSGPRTAPSQPQSRTILSIESLNPYSNNWMIKALVAQKSEIREWSKYRNEGRVFNVTFMDDTGEIRGACFNEAVDQLYDKLEEGKVFYVSKAKVTSANKRFNDSANEYELVLEKKTEVKECAGEGRVPAVKYNFIKLSDLINKPVNSTCDVIAIIREAGEASPFTTRDNRSTTKRELTLVDRSNLPVRLTLWGKQAEAYEDDGSNPVVAFKGVRIGEFRGRTLSAIGSSMIAVNPNIPEAHVLRGWYDSIGVKEGSTENPSTGPESGGTATFNRASVRTIEDIKANPWSVGGAKVFSCRGTIKRVLDESLTYPACPNRLCQKKVRDTQGNGWHCDKCGETWDKPEYRYIITMIVSDYSGQTRLQGFNDVGMAVFDMPADELMEIKRDDPDRYPAILSKLRYSTFNFACRANFVMYQGRQQAQFGVSKVLPLNYRAEAAYLRDVLNSDWAK